MAFACPRAYEEGINVHFFMGRPSEDFRFHPDDRLIVKMVMMAHREDLQLNVGYEPVGV
jgi:hypothetical protein